MAAKVDFSDAVRLHQQGCLEPAEEAYRRILSVEPQHAGVLHLLGVICIQRRDYCQGIELIGRAIAITPSTPAFHNNYGLALYGGGRVSEARDALIRALSLQPNYVQSLANLGMVEGALGCQRAVIPSQGAKLKSSHFERSEVRRRGSSTAEAIVRDNSSMC